MHLNSIMSTDGKMRPWRIIADEIARESDPKRIIALSDELNAAVAEQGIDHEPDPGVSIAARAKNVPLNDKKAGHSK